MSITGRVAVTVDLEDIRSSDAASLREKISAAFGWDVLAGTGAGQANLMWQDTSTIGTGETWSLDLAGTMVNSLGGPVVFSKIKAIAVKAGDGNTTALTISRPAANGAAVFAAGGDALQDLDAGDAFLLTKKGAGITVTAGSADLLYITNAAGASAEASVILLGLS